MGSAASVTEEETFRKRERPQASELAGSVVVVLCAGVLFGWLFGFHRLVQLHPALVPMQFNAALGLSLCGGAHLLLARAPRWAAAAAALALGLGAATGMEYAFGTNLGIDELFFRHDVIVKTSSPGRMAPTTAAALVLSGSTLLLAAAGIGARWSSNCVATASSTLLALGAGTLLGYASGYELTYGWKQATYMAAHTALAAALLGLAGLEIALRRSERPEGEMPAWAPWCAGWLVLALSVGLAHTLWARERAVFARALAFETQTAADGLRDSVLSIRAALSRMGRQELDGDGLREAGHYLEAHESVVALLHASPSLELDWRVGGSEVDGGDRLLAALAERRAVLPSGASTLVVDLASDEPALSLVVPIRDEGRLSGFLLAALDLRALTADLSERASDAGFRFTLLEGRRALLSEGSPGSSNWPSRTVPLPFAGSALRLVVAPGPDFASLPSHALPVGVLGGGALAAALLGLALHFGRLSNARARALKEQQERLERAVSDRTRELSDVNESLRRENAERRRAEGEARSRAEQLAVLHRLVREITASADVSEIYEKLTSELKRLVAFDASTLLAVEEASESYWLEAGWDGERSMEPDGERRPIEPSAIATQLVEPRPTVAARPRAGLDAAVIDGVRTILYVPLTIQGNMLGVLTLQSRAEDAFPPELVATLTPIAAQLALALNKARLYQQSLRYASELEGRVEARTAELERAVRELEAFSYSVSHDLRAPLRHVSGFVDLLKRHSEGSLDETSLRYLGIIEEATKRMGQLIDDLLEFSRLGRRELVPKTFSLEEMVAEVLLELRPDTEGRPLEILLGELPEVCGDRSLLRLVVTNLLSNALKFTRGREPARIEIRAERSSDETTVVVADDGVGFDMKYADKLFRVFQRLHHAEDFEGTGIGLANASRIVQRHGGRIWAESRPGEGATFRFTLPTHAMEVPLERAETYFAG